MFAELWYNGDVAYSQESRYFEFCKNGFWLDKGGVTLRLNRFMAESGVCSRREADRIIESGQVTINGQIAVLGTQVLEGDVVIYEGRQLTPVTVKHYIAVNKPPGIEVTMNRDVEGNLADFLGLTERLFPVGRLDKASEGLLLMTNDGDTANAILKAANGHEKEYLVQVDKTLTTVFIRTMETGVPILETITAPCIVQPLERDVFKIILKQGMNRQIRRMCEALGYTVLALKRVRIMDIHLATLPLGQWRDLTADEIKGLLRATQK